MDHLILSLGHNSSAILIRDGVIVNGIENERLSQIKSDSHYPMQAIEYIHAMDSIRPDCEVLIGHWALDGNLSSMSAKHWNPDHIKQRFPQCTIQTLSADSFTHHDSHAYSALSFAGEFPEDNTHLIVMDGFGTMGEHMSFYRVINGQPILQERKFGFGTSMGLFYQYSTAFMGMRMNQDEYKILAFEAHIAEVEPYIRMRGLYAQITRWSEYFLTLLDDLKHDHKADPMLNVAALPEFASRVARIHQSVLEDLHATELPEAHRKIITAYFTQAVVEEVVSGMIAKIAPTNVILVGGLFYNVKINAMISRMVPGKTCVMPLAGDQGAALGLYHAKYDLKWPGNLAWGKRHRNVEQHEGMHWIHAGNHSEISETMGSLISEHGMVNLVRGNMEFGPRALCNTSCIAVPDTQLASYINKINHRTNEMPFAPVILRRDLDEYFVDGDRIHKSLEYMIVTRDYNDGVAKENLGAAHWDTNRGVYTGRPQLIDDDPVMAPLLSEFGLLINTSYNYHGVPIVFNLDTVVYTHQKQWEHSDPSRRPHTVITIED